MGYLFLITILAIVVRMPLLFSVVCSKNNFPWFICHLTALSILTIYVYVNGIVTPGGDELGYIHIANSSEINSLTDLTNFYSIEQPGFPAILFVLGSILKAGAIGVKLLNMLVFYLITCETVTFGAKICEKLSDNYLNILILLSPLAYYSIFLLKDLYIVFSTMALINLMLANQFKSKGTLFIFIHLLNLINFRTYAVIYPACVLLFIYLYDLLISRKSYITITGNSIIQIITGVISFFLVIVILGFQFENSRVIFSQDFHNLLYNYLISFEGSLISSIYAYIFVDTSYASLLTYNQFDFFLLRSSLIAVYSCSVSPCLIPAYLFLTYQLTRNNWYNTQLKITSNRNLSICLLLPLLGLIQSVLIQETVRYRLFDIPYSAILFILYAHTNRKLSLLCSLAYCVTIIIRIVW